MGIRKRLTLRRSDGRAYLDRRGVGIRRLGGVYIHRFDAPDPGEDVHDHPWWFASFVVKGGYTEAVVDVRTPNEVKYRTWRRWSIHRIRLDEAHQIVQLAATPTWTVVLRGPFCRQWGFYEPTGWVPHWLSLRDRRDLRVEQRGGES